MGIRWPVASAPDMLGTRTEPLRSKMYFFPSRLRAKSWIDPPSETAVFRATLVTWCPTRRAAAECVMSAKELLAHVRTWLKANRPDLL